ncbi:recombination protein RecR [Candidatus Roizmanbacteria bacterium]|nr:recombination protein RecR [Candidatus Roizmanbacteria bacterium]
MSTLPSSLKQIALFLERLPGIGEKTANRLAFYLLRLPEEDLKEFAKHVGELKARTKLCKICFNFTENKGKCDIDEDSSRDHATITVVEEVMDLLSFETGNIYKGIYHVLHGKIDPLNNIRPEDLYISALVKRLLPTEKALPIKEIILATNPDMEGEATAMFIKKRLEEVKKQYKREFKITRLAYGLPIGASLEYADYMTLKKSLENRNQF